MEAVQLVKSSGKPMSQIARELGVSDSALYQWCKHLADQGEQAFPGSGHQSAKARGNPSPEAGTGSDPPGARYFKKRSHHLLTGVQMKYQFIATDQQEYPISTMCRVLQVSASGYYAWRQRTPSRRSREDAMLTERICQIYQANRQVYGSPRIHAALHANGQACGKKRVARLMRACGLSAKLRRHRTRTTDSQHEHPVAANV